MYFGVLGPLVVRPSDSDPIVVPAALQRGVLAILLSRANQIVSRDELSETLWDGQNPGTARTTLAAYVSRLRRVLGPQAARRIRTRPPGYVIDVDPEEYDCAQAEELCRRAGLAAERGDWPSVGRLAAEGLRLWRGTPYQDVPVARLHREDAAALEATRMRLTELTVDADLRLGRADTAISTLRRLTEQEPLRECFYEKLMTSLSDQGRRAEALAVFHQARKALQTNLGIDPGPELTRVHQAVLLASGAQRPAPAPGSAAPAPASAPPPAPVPIQVAAAGPRQLPPAAPHFTGREAELAQMDQAAEAGEALVLSGMAGIGKTALAVQWAHRIAPRYPDGQVFVNLHGFDPRTGPMSAHDACAIILESLGVASSAIPADPDARTALYRTAVADRHLLVVLDDASDAEQVRPLIPGSATGQVVATSRNRLAGLVAADGARPVILAPLDGRTGVELLTRRAGLADAPGRPGPAPSHAAALAEACGGVPLALTIAAARLRLDPELAWSALTARLRDRQAALSTLDVGEASGSLRAVLSVSYQRLSPRAAALFRLLGVHPGPDISAAAAVSLAGADPDETEQALDELTAASLLHRHAGRFGLHDLIRAYACEAARQATPEERRAARLRVYDHYLRTGIAGEMLLRPMREPLAPPPAVPGARPESFADAAEATAWYQAEREVLPAVVALAVRHGDDEYTHRLPWTMSTYLNRRGEWPALAELHRLAADAADRTGAARDRARAHNDVASFLLQVGAFDTARHHLEISAPLWRDLGDERGAWLSEHNLGHLCHNQGRHEEAAAHADRALELARALGPGPELALALSTVAWSRIFRGDHEGALAMAGEAIELNHRIEDRSGEAHAHDTMGLASYRLGRIPEALAAYDRALSMFREMGDVRFQGRVLTRIAQAHQAGGDRGAAAAAWAEALALFEQVGAPEADEARIMVVSSRDGDRSPSP